jgi:hypothetical protein
MATTKTAKALKLDRNIVTITAPKKNGFLKRIRPLFNALAKDNISLTNVEKSIKSFDDFLWNKIRETFDVHTVEQSEMIREFIADSYQWTVKRKGKGKEDSATKRLTAPKQFSQFFSDIRRSFNNNLIDVDLEYSDSILDHISGKKENIRTTIFKNIFDEYETIGELRKALREHIANSKSEDYKDYKSDSKLVNDYANSLERSEKKSDKKKLKLLKDRMRKIKQEFSLAPKAIKTDKTNKTIVESE